MRRKLQYEEPGISAKSMFSARDVRHSVLMLATLRIGNGAASARVRNISRSGMMAEGRFRGAVGDPVRIAMRGLGEIGGSIVWIRDDRIGMTFERSINPERVLRRRSPPPSSRLLRSHMPWPVRAWRPGLRVQ